MTKYVDTALLIIGSEGAGSMAAISAYDYAVEHGSKLKITIVTKGRIGKTGATLTGGADISCDSRSLNELGFLNTNPEDSKEIFFKDVVKGGKYLNNQKLVKIFVEDAPERIKDLLAWGGGWEGIERGTQYLKKRAVYASGHSYARGAYQRGPRTMHVLKEQVKKRNVELIEYIMITDLLTTDNKISGAVGINLLTGEYFTFKTKAVVMATGGFLELYPYSTGPVELTGDGQAMAFRAGAELQEMEFPMFIPGAFIYPPSIVGDLAPFLLAAGGEVHGWILNRKGERFMKRWDPEHMELTTRDIISIASMMEVMNGWGSPHGGVFYSLTHLPEDLVSYIRDQELNLKNPKRQELTTRGEPHANCPHSTNYDDYFKELHRYSIEALAACHYSNGGIKVNERTETNIPGFFAGGECIGGMMGANRLSGNAFMEFFIWGYRAGRFAAEYALNSGEVNVNDQQVEKLREKIFAPLERNNGIKPIKFRRQLQKLAWEKVGIVRSGEGLNFAIREIKQMWNDIPCQFVSSKSKTYNREWFEALENENMLLCLELAARAALIRKESRGAHYRTDFPKTDYINWTKNIIVKLEDSKAKFMIVPAVITTFPPPQKITKYGVVE